MGDMQSTVIQAQREKNSYQLPMESFFVANTEPVQKLVYLQGRRIWLSSLVVDLNTHISCS